MARQPIVEEAEHGVVLSEALLRSQREVVIDEGGIDAGLECGPPGRATSLALVSLERLERHLHGVDRHRSVDSVARAATGLITQGITEYSPIDCPARSAPMSVR